MYKFYGYKRESFVYNDGWKELDSETYVGVFKVLKLGPVVYQDTYGETSYQTITVAAPRGVSDADVVQVLKNEWTRGCRCEHDCCGHTQTHVWEVRHTKRREWLVVINLVVNC